MSSTESRKEEGTVEKAGGTIKEKIGEAVGSERLEAEGKAQYLRGHERREVAKAEERGKATLERIGAKLKNRLGAFMGHRRAQAEGRAGEAKAEKRAAENRPSAPSLH
jgi:uncharacterized protein YjbJ (UPF0337 family)